jgi:hypothetical protein
VELEERQVLPGHEPPPPERTDLLQGDLQQTGLEWGAVSGLAGHSGSVSATSPTVKDSAGFL